MGIETESEGLQLLNQVVSDVAPKIPERLGSWLATDKDRERRPRRRRRVLHFSFGSYRHGRKMNATRCTPQHSKMRWP